MEGSGGGAGGAFRRRPFRRAQPTPYDRPPTALRPAQAAAAAAAAERNNWFSSKFLDPASRLITAGAHKLFASVFRGRLLPPPPPQPPQHPPPDENTEIRDVQPEATPVVVHSSARERAIGGGNDANRISDSNGVSELEDILKQKSFTRSEIDHLTALLLSRTVDNPVGAGNGRSEPKFPDQWAIHGRHSNETDLAVHENEIDRGAPGAITTPTLRSKVVEEDVASPAELAKAYMGSRPTRVSPSVLSLQNQMPSEDLSASRNPTFKLRSPGTSLLQKPVSDTGTSENGFVTPRFRGRSAIYSMARTPYSRIHPAPSLKAGENAFDARAGSSSSQNETQNNLFNSSRKQVLKRRSSVLENDIGSVGPIRRIRQKPNLLHPKTLSLPASGGPRATHGPGALLDAPEVPTSFSRSSHIHSLSKATADNSTPSTSSGYVPSQSIEMAEKIFQQLDKITPKGKSSELKIDIAGGNSPAKMTPEMLGGLARRSMETVDSMKVLQSIRDSKRENGPVNSVDTYFVPPKISSKVEETSMKKFDVSSDNVATQNGAEVVVRTSHSSDNDNAKDMDSVKSQSGSDQPPKKRAFQMSAHEDFLELDDDVHVNGVSTPSSEGTQGTDVPKPAAGMPNIPPQSEAIGVGKPSVPEQKPSGASLLTKKVSEPLPDVSVPAGKAAAFTFPVVPSSTPATSQAAVSTPPLTSQCDKAVPLNESNNGFPMFGTKSEKFPPLTFSSTRAAESAIQKDTKLEFASSANDTAAPKANGPAENDKKSTQERVNVFKKPEDAPPPVTSTAKGIFNFGMPAINAIPTIGSLSTVSTTAASSPVLFSSTSSNQSSLPVTSSVPSFPSSDSSSLSNGFASSTSSSTNAASMGSTGTESSTPPFSASSSLQSSSMTAPSVSPGPTFLFGSSSVPSTTTTIGASASKSTESSAAKANETAFGSTTSSLFGTKSSVTANGGNDVSALNASALKSAGGEAPAAAPAASNGSIFGFQASSSSAPVSTSTQSFSSPFPSQASSPIFGLGTATNFSSGASVFATNTFSSGTTSASTLGASSSSSFSSSSGSASSIFGSSWQPSKPTNTISTFGSMPASTGFSFGAAVSGPSVDNNKAPVVFGSSAPSSSAAGNSAGFVFGAASSSAAPVFSFSSATSTAPPSSSQPAFGNTSTPAFAFGSSPSGNNDQMSMEDSMAEDSVQASTPAAPVFGQSPISAPSPGFMFGATPSPGFGGTAAPPTANPFQFGSQPSQMAPQSPSPFQPSGSVEFNASGAGSFSLGTGGGDKSNRKIVKVKGRLRRK